MQYSLVANSVSNAVDIYYTKSYYVFLNQIFIAVQLRSVRDSDMVRVIMVVITRIMYDLLYY